MANRSVFDEMPKQGVQVFFKAAVKPWLVFLSLGLIQISWLVFYNPMVFFHDSMMGNRTVDFLTYTVFSLAIFWCILVITLVFGKEK